MSAVFGPYATERDTMASPLGAAIRVTRPELGSYRAIQMEHLRQACAGAGVELGAYDERILAWLATYEPATVQVVIGLISRAHAAGLAQSQPIALVQARDLARRWATVGVPHGSVLEEIAELLGKVGGPLITNEIDDSLSEPGTTVYAPCQPIGCDNEMHLPGCVYALVDEGGEDQ